MKTIEAISIWTNGITENVTVLDARAIDVKFNHSATFYYSLMSQREDGALNAPIAQGNLLMTIEDYEQWNLDNFAWNWIASQLNTVITGDYIQWTPPASEPVTTDNTTTYNMPE